MTPQEKAKELEQTYNDFTYQACIAITNGQCNTKATKHTKQPTGCNTKTAL